jgi:phosphoglycerol transferase MdoB-like AlkP superfamily enzyme
MVMSESLWDPTRLNNAALSPDPMPTMRANSSGNLFSPEFGGMTANVEFEALTGFSNAFLPYGSIPYQQYVRRPLPSLATFFASKGYTTRAFHPFQSWFWNRANVYQSLGFQSFMSEENMPVMDKRGLFTSDDALTKEIIRSADQTKEPFFFFAVTLQGHGPYEKNRYAKNTINVQSAALAPENRDSLATYAQGVREADSSLKALMDWAKKRRRETIIVLFGDHLPPLGNVYTETGYMPDVVATRKASVGVMKREHETPLVVWSSKRGVQKDLGSISPSQLPYYVVRLAGYRHAFYTGVLGRLHERYAVVDRHQLSERNDRPHSRLARPRARSIRSATTAISSTTRCSARALARSASSPSRRSAWRHRPAEASAVAGQPTAIPPVTDLRSPPCVDDVNRPLTQNG